MANPTAIGLSLLCAARTITKREKIQLDLGVFQCHHPGQRWRGAIKCRQSSLCSSITVCRKCTRAPVFCVLSCGRWGHSYFWPTHSDFWMGFLDHPAAKGSHACDLCVGSDIVCGNLCFCYRHPGTEHWLLLMGYFFQTEGWVLLGPDILVPWRWVCPDTLCNVKRIRGDLLVDTETTAHSKWSTYDLSYFQRLLYIVFLSAISESV